MIEARNRFVDQVKTQVRRAAVELGVTGLDPRAAETLRQVPRDRFVPASERQPV